MIEKDFGDTMRWNYTKDENLTDFFDDNIYSTLSIVAWILIICGILENAVICWILVRKKKCMKSFANFHLLSLAITDISFRIVTTPDFLQVQNILKSDIMCKIVEFGKNTTLAVTFALLAGIALDRYIHIVYPFRARSITWKHSRNLVALSWIYGALCSAPFLYSVKVETLFDYETLETFSICYDVPGLPFIISVTVFLGFSFLTPLFVMGVVYSKIVRVLWSRERRNVINKNMVKIKIRAVKMMVVVVLTYVVTWGPKLVLLTMEAFYFEEETLKRAESGEDEGFHRHRESEQEKEMFTLIVLSIAFETLSLASSVVNPLVFGYYNSSFRQELKNIYSGITDAKCFRKRKQEVAPRPMKIHIYNSEAKHTNDGPRKVLHNFFS